MTHFGFGVHDQPVGFIDHLLFADRAQWRLRRVAIRERGVLDCGESVRRVHQWHRPAVPRQPSHLTGQPVVGVDDVVVPRFVIGLGAQDSGGEGAQLGREVVFVQAFERAGHHIANHHPGSRAHDRRIRR